LNGPAVKADRTRRRNEIIQSWARQGLAEEEIYKLMMEHHPDLLQIGRRPGKKRFTTLDNMMLKYRRSDRGENNSNRSERMQ
jgi:hypothetical protein